MSKKLNLNSATLNIDNFPLSLKRDIAEICADECSSVTEFVKHTLRKEVIRRKPELAPLQFKRTT